MFLVVPFEKGFYFWFTSNDMSSSSKYQLFVVVSWIPHMGQTLASVSWAMCVVREEIQGFFRGWQEILWVRDGLNIHLFPRFSGFISLRSRAHFLSRSSVAMLCILSTISVASVGRLNETVLSTTLPEMEAWQIFVMSSYQVVGINKVMCAK